MNWVSVLDEKPKPNSKVIGVSTETEEVDLFHYTTYGEFWPDGLMVLSPNKITHWMYLPGE